MTSPEFDGDFLCRLDELFVWRRDVRRFRREPLAEGVLQALLERTHWSPSVGNSQPWRFIHVAQAARRAAVIEDFTQCNRAALQDYHGARARLYAQLKLAGLRDAPTHLAVFTDTDTTQGHGLGRKTMPEMLHYSTVCMVMSLWLQARARGVGVGWVSIIDPRHIATILDAPVGWQLDAYLCLGYPDAEDSEPALARAGWQARDDGPVLLER